MRKGFLLLLSLIIVLAACKPKDEKTRAVKAEIGGFGRDWAATTEILNNWGLNMQQKLSVDSLLSDDCKTLKTDYKTALKNWNVASTAFEDWKRMFDEGELKTEDATQTLKEYKAMLKKYNASVIKWKTILDNCVQELNGKDILVNDSINQNRLRLN